ncbi:hypothetical protein BDV27DRAFT_135219, partial [Aspergillus caelatus]
MGCVLGLWCFGCFCFSGFGGMCGFDVRGFFVLCLVSICMYVIGSVCTRYVSIYDSWLL